MASTHTLTGNVFDLAGVPLVGASNIGVRVVTNLGPTEALVDKTTNRIHLGGRPATVDLSGNFAVTLVDTSATDLNVVANTLEYQVEATYTDKAAPGLNGRKTWTSGWFPLTTDANLADITTDVSPMAVESASAFALDAADSAAAAETARAAVESVVIADLGTTDGQTKTLVETPGSLTDAALGAKYATKPGNGARAVGRGEHAIRVDDYLTIAGSASTAAEETAAWVAAINVAKTMTRDPSGGWYRGMPRLLAGPRVWRITSSLPLKSFYGLTIEGHGFQSTILRIDSGISLFELQRSQDVTFRKLTLACGDTATPWTTGLIENSCGVWMHEDSTDSGIPGTTTAVLFDQVRFLGFHRGIQVNGNQMCDNVSFRDCRWTDNFFDFDVANGQAVNFRVIGGEMGGFVGTTENLYNQRLALWSPASVPASAKAGQYQDPALTTGAQQNVTVRDGAHFRIVAGGELHCDNRLSIVGRKTWLLLGSVPTTGATALLGTSSNSLAYIFEGCTGEFRAVDAVLDVNGLQRVTLVRNELPFAALANLSTVAPSIYFNRSRVTIAQTDVDVLHVAGPMTVRWHDMRILGGGTNRRLKLCHTSGVSAGVPGSFDGRRSTILTPVIDARTTAGAAATAPVAGTHYVEQIGSSFGSGMAYDATSPVVMRSRLVASNRPFEAVYTEFRNTDGTVLGSAANTVGNTKTFQLGAGATIKRVGIVLSSVTSGTPGPIVLRFRDAAGTTTYVDLTATWANTTTATESVGPYGKIFDAHRRPWAEVHDFAPADGRVVVEVLTKTTAVIVGFVWIESY